MIMIIIIIPTTPSCLFLKITLITETLQDSCLKQMALSTYRLWLSLLFLLNLFQFSFYFCFTFTLNVFSFFLPSTDCGSVFTLHKHGKNCECCPRHSLFKGHKVIVNIVVLNCQQCLISVSQVSSVRSQNFQKI